MYRSTPHTVAPTIESRPPLNRFLWVAALYGVLLTVVAIYAFRTATPALVVFAGIVTIAGHGLAHSYPHTNLGLCNAVTLARAALVAFLAGAVVSQTAPAWAVFGVAVVAFALDGVDGWLARRAGLVSDFGARFDMETDAGLGAVMSLWLWTSGISGPEILVLGFMRYAFVIASMFWPVLQNPLPHSLRRKAICVVQIGALVLLAYPLTPPALAAPVAVTAALLLSWSFLTDILWLARRPA